MTSVDLLNRRLGESLGRVCGGSLPRFAWKYAPDQPRYVYDTDDRTVLKKSWADAPAPDGGVIGKVWVLAEWRVSKVADHCGYGDGIRIAVTKEAGYAPYYETAIAPGRMPTDVLTANYISALRTMLGRSAEHQEDSFENYMGDEKLTSDRNSTRERQEHRDRSAHIYDNHVGAFGNCEPGRRDGWMSFQNVESGPASDSVVAA